MKEKRKKKKKKKWPLRNREEPVHPYKVMPPFATEIDSVDLIRLLCLFFADNYAFIA